MAKFRTVQEKTAFRIGFLVGLRKKTSSPKKRSTSSRSQKISKQKARGKLSLMDEIKEYRKKNLGALYRNGKYYDTNFIDEPVEITKAQLRDLHDEYDVSGSASDSVVADRFVHHMRKKYGVFDNEGHFLHIWGEK